MKEEEMDEVDGEIEEFGHDGELEEQDGDEEEEESRQGAKRKRET